MSNPNQGLRSWYQFNSVFLFDFCFSGSNHILFCDIQHSYSKHVQNRSYHYVEINFVISRPTSPALFYQLLTWIQNRIKMFDKCQLTCSFAVYVPMCYFRFVIMGNNVGNQVSYTVISMGTDCLYLILHSWLPTLEINSYCEGFVLQWKN